MIKSKVLLPELDGLRFIAFLLIFIHHSSTQGVAVFREIKTIGWLGVEIFFCLSAFLLTRLLLREMDQFGTVDVYKFFMRRILRIWPLYFTYVIVAIILSIYWHVITSDNVHRIVGLLTFTDNFFDAFQGFNPIRFTGHLWTISYEEQFYLCLPFFVPYLLQLTPPKRIMFLVTLLIVSQVAKCISVYNRLDDPFIWTIPITHPESIIAGMMMAFYENTCASLNRMLVGATIVASACLIFFMPDTTTMSYSLVLTYPLAGLFSASVVCFSIHENPTPFKNFLSNNIIRFLGRISFGLYVFHSLCMNAVDTVMGFSHPLWSFFMSLAAVVVVSSASYHLFEKRFLMIKKTRFTRIPVSG